jgi:hypothetical protein
MKSDRNTKNESTGLIFSFLLTRIYCLIKYNIIYKRVERNMNRKKKNFARHVRSMCFCIFFSSIKIILFAWVRVFRVTLTNNKGTRVFRVCPSSSNRMGSTRRRGETQKRFFFIVANNPVFYHVSRQLYSS